MTTEDTGQGAYGTRHVMEEQMRAAGVGVFEEKSSEVGRKALAESENKMLDVPETKALSKMTKDELLATAAEEGVAVETDDNKADLIAKIEKARG